MKIQLLDESVASQIAAGEVVERPLSVVKELVENSLDSEATEIEIELENGGLKLIKVIDNGVGIPRDQLELALTRYATSKLTSVDDLSSIQTLGFRGEALASIRSVSDLILVSREDSDRTGNYITYKNGDIFDRGIQGANRGTSVSVSDLFANFPARLSFLKSARAEGRRCSQLVARYAVAYPKVSFRFFQDGNLVFHSAGDGNQRDIIGSVWGDEIAQELLPLEEMNIGNVRIEGFVSPPGITRGRKDLQVFFANDRLVEVGFLSFAVADFYRNINPKGRYPVVFLFVNCEPNKMDVNVHPAKIEIKFKNEGEIFSALSRSLNNTLKDVVIEIQKLGVLSGMEEPFHGTQFELEEPSQELNSNQVGKIIDGKITTANSGPINDLHPLAQINTTYIVAQGRDGIFIIDQHAAHERIIFENIIMSQENGLPTVQGLLDPIPINLDSSQKENLSMIGPSMYKYGFQWDKLEKGNIILRGIPISLKESETVSVFKEILDLDTVSDTSSAEGDQKSRSSLETRDREIAASVACHSSIRAGQALLFSEMEAMLSQFQDAGYPKLCPHGRPTTLFLSHGKLDAQFGR
jgi:DNA mismatch repair protein MutL